jgi:AhpD family alkylhydroperoxidase
MATEAKAARKDQTKAIHEEVRQLFGEVPTWLKQLPDSVLGGFWSTMRDFQLAETAIPNKYKELIGLGVSGATRCRYCTLFHTEAARLFGASDEEIAEASAMAAHTMSASTFLNAQQVDYETFRRETLDAISYVRSHQQPPAPGGRPGATAHA